MLYYVQFKNEYLNTEDRRHVRQTEVKNEADMRRTKESRRECPGESNSATRGRQQ